ncbi:MAG TPA: type III pantothenate kinase [Chromatiales bacterium]|nr:type III pantothenate kinase [Thiotrichales bacterium]HIP68653.1 type III pantothenate kinase [Chromatiales bacterium]
MKTCLLDMGNTRWKWMAPEDDDLVLHQYEYMKDPVEGIIKELDQMGMPEKLFVASVRHEDLNNALQKALEAKGCKVRLLNWRDCVEIKTAYKDPSRLGIDRYLNMLGALHLYQPPFIVVSAGTAVTVDAVDEKGVHLGGAIFPGRRLLANVLTENTDRVDMLQPADHDTIFAQSTEAAVLAGTKYGFIAAVAGIVNTMRETLGEQTRIILTGGDAPVLEKHMPGGSKDTNSTLLFTGMRDLLTRQ